jgi:hypothetical protein
VRDRRAHIKVSRRFFEEDAWWNEPRRFSKAEAWIDCIQMASWKARRYAIGLEVEQLERGEFMASLRYLAQRWRWGKSAVSDFLKALVKRGHIRGQREGQMGTVYLLVNYDAYQSGDRGPPDTSPDTKPDSSRTPPGHLPDKTEAVKAGKAVRASWLTPYSDAWQTRCGEPPFGKLVKVLAPLHTQHGDEALTRWRRYLEQTDPQFCSVHRFAETWVKWGGPEIQEMTDEFGRMVPHRKNGAGEWVPVAAIA